jgi:hypothetical protein
MDDRTRHGGCWGRGEGAIIIILLAWHLGSLEDWRIGGLEAVTRFPKWNNQLHCMVSGWLDGERRANKGSPSRVSPRCGLPVISTIELARLEGIG